MAGPEGNLDKGWETINSVIDMDPAELFGRYLGCNHHEQRQVMLSRDDHPFAYVSDKKSTAAAGLAAEPTRTEDHWEIDPDLGTAIKHHVYPRKRLYVPTVEGLKSFPSISSNRITVLESGEQIEDVLYENIGAKRNEWWVGSTYFPLVESADFAQSVATAAAKKKAKGARSKTEAKREAKQEKFKDPSTIEPEVIPAMTKPVNIMTYDMRDFLSSCVDRYCELANVQRSSLKHVATPFHENRIAKPAAEDEPPGQLQPIASKVFMKILFATRMARWDLLRATQGLASRSQKGLVTATCSSLDVKMQGSIGDKIGDCKLWLFCDADWAGEYDSKPYNSPRPQAPSEASKAPFAMQPCTVVVGPELRKKPNCTERNHQQAQLIYQLCQARGRRRS